MRIIKILVAGVVLFSGVLYAQAPDGETPTERAADQSKDALDDYMLQWQKSIQPNEYHAALEPFIGIWIRSYHYLLNPEADEDFRLDRKMIFGGRFLWEEESGIDDRIVAGYAVEGYNKATGEYERVFWHDVGTGITKWKGSMDKQEGTFVYRGKFLEPVMKTWIETKLVSRMVSPDRVEKVFYEAKSPADGAEPESWRKTMEIVEVLEQAEESEDSPE
jgi:hypothetical protein